MDTIDEPSGLSFHTYSAENITFIRDQEIKAMQDTLTRTMQLEDLQKLHEEKRFSDLVNILKTTLSVIAIKAPDSNK